MLNLTTEDYLEVREALNSTLDKMSLSVTRKHRKRMLQAALTEHQRKINRANEVLGETPVHHGMYSDPTAVRAIKNYLRENPEAVERERLEYAFALLAA